MYTTWHVIYFERVLVEIPGFDSLTVLYLCFPILKCLYFATFSKEVQAFEVSHAGRKSQRDLENLDTNLSSCQDFNWDME